MAGQLCPWIILMCLVSLNIALANKDNRIEYSGLRNFCSEDGFLTSCEPSEVIVMRTARYGRMEIGECVKQDFGFVGCQNNVVSAMSRLCSGLQTCQIENLAGELGDLPTKNPPGKKRCATDLKEYLEASWDCVKVITKAVTDGMCAMGYVNVPLPEGVLASITADDTFGTDACPWLVKAEPGQRINITLVDFSRSTRPTRGRTKYCREYGTLLEAGVPTNIVVCDGDPPEKHVFITETNVVEIRLTNTKVSKTSTRFIIKYKVLGCPSPDPPAYGYLEPTGNDALVRCNYSTDTWTLRCKNGGWIGFVGNCTKPGILSGRGAQYNTPEFLSLGLTLVIIVGVAIIICVVTLVIGLVHLKRRRERQPRLPYHDETLIYNMPRGGQLTKEQDMQMQQHFASVDHSPCRTYSPLVTRIRDANGGEYGQIWEVQHQCTGAMSPSGGMADCCQAMHDAAADSQARRKSDSALNPADKRAGNATLPKKQREAAKGAFTTFKPYSGPEGVDIIGSCQPSCDCTSSSPCYMPECKPPLYFTLDPNLPANMQNEGQCPTRYPATTTSSSHAGTVASTIPNDSHIVDTNRKKRDKKDNDRAVKLSS